MGLIHEKKRLKISLFSLFQTKDEYFAKKVRISQRSLCELKKDFSLRTHILAFAGANNKITQKANLTHLNKSKVIPTTNSFNRFVGFCKYQGRALPKEVPKFRYYRKRKNIRVSK